MQIDEEDEFSRHLRLRWTRGDADRYMRPDAGRYMQPAYLPPPYRKSAVSAGQADAAARPLGWLDDDEVAQIRCELASLRLELVLLRFAAGGRKALHHSNFQPRVSAGNPDGGQWTDGGGGTDGGATGGRVRVAQADGPPEIPKDRPATQRERNVIARSLAKWLPRLSAIGGIIAHANWLNEELPSIIADHDPPRSLEELQAASFEPKKGYDIHHIVEQALARRDGFSEEMIEAADNRVRIPRYKHWAINAWYETRSEKYGGLTPRSYLRGKSWEERRSIGIEALIEFRVLK